MEKNAKLLTEIEKIKHLMNYLDAVKVIKEELIRHIKVTYDDNGEIMKKEVLFLDKPYNIKGKNFDSEVRELNLGANQEVYPSNN